MSFSTWHNYGYGVRTDDVKIDSPDRIKELIHLAPEYEKSVEAFLSEAGIADPTVEDYLEQDEDFHDGLATILAEVIEEVEQITFTHCDDWDGRTYLIYPPSYPWLLPESEAALTEERIAAVLAKYISVLTDDPVEIDYQEVENGG